MTTYTTPPTLSAGITVKASQWNVLVTNLNYLNDRVTALEAAGTVPPDYSSFPINAIVAYSGGTATLPSGWYVCNGGTVGGTVLPDLRSRFIYGAASALELGTTGGTADHTHTGGATSTDGSHSHNVSASTGGPSATVSVDTSIGGIGAASSGHVHSVNASTQSGGSHSHTVGTSGSASNLPPYVKLYYITRLG